MFSRAIKSMFLLFIFVFSFVSVFASSYVDKWISYDENNIVQTILFEDFKILSGLGFEYTPEGLVLPIDGAVEISFDVPEDGLYLIVLHYMIDSDKVLTSRMSMFWDNNELTVPLLALWTDETKDYPTDRYGNEVVPRQVMVKQFHSEYVRDYGSLSAAPYVFEFEKGRQNIKLRNESQSVILNSVILLKYEKVQTYEDYILRMPNSKVSGEIEPIEAEGYLVKSDSFIRPGNQQDPSLHPYETVSRKLNIIDGNSWDQVGQKVMWEFDVPEDGIYYFAFRYSQSINDGISVFRNVYIDGEIIFSELMSYMFPYTGLRYKNVFLEEKNSGEPFGIWLKKGTHTISLEVDGTPLDDVINELRNLIFEINQSGLEIKKLTGGVVDKNRKWDIQLYLPDIVTKFEGWANELDDIYNEIEAFFGQTPASIINLKIAAKNIRDLAKEPDKIPIRLNKLSEGFSSASNLISETIDVLSTQPLNLDRIYVLNSPVLPDDEVVFLTRFMEGLKRFVFSFFPQNKEYMAVSDKKSDELLVWVNRPIQYVEMLQQMTDSDFTSKTGISVRFSVMPNEQKLILANAANISPDLALGISNYIPYDLAIRGAVFDLTEFDDFWEYISREYNLETLIPFYVDGKVYGVTETQDFYVLFYRKDILESLNLEVPQTWDEVQIAMSTLYRNSMNFYLPMAGWTGLKPFYTTVPFIYQSGGRLYTDDGLKTAVNEENSIKGFEIMTKLFTIYSVSQSVPNFYNEFRYGRIPMGVSNFTTYVMLMTAAPEIASQWDIALSPGVKDENGEILRYQVGSDRADVLFSSSDKKEEAWEFLKWWLSKDTQVEYAYRMQTRYGPEYMWNTANMAAFEELSFPDNHKKVILEQWGWMKEIPRHPAGYMLEREISNAWTDVVMNGEGIRIAVDKAAITINREIIRKMEEFGYIKDGKVVKTYQIPSIENIKAEVEKSK